VKREPESIDVLSKRVSRANSDNINIFKIERAQQNTVTNMWPMFSDMYTTAVLLS
jgi:hypothetical protein